MIKEEDKQYLNNPDYSLPLEKFFDFDYYRSNDKFITNLHGKIIFNNNAVVIKADPFANEKVEEVYNCFGECNKVLTIGSSGDQALEAILRGAQDITIADLNIFTKYWVDYKIAAIKNLSFYDFLSCFDDEENLRTKAFNYSTFKRLFHDLDEESATFWGTLFLEGVESNDIYRKMLRRDDVNYKAKGCNFYDSKKEYEKMQEILRESNYNLKYVNADFVDFPKVIKDKYDTIYLSNVCKYVDETKYVEVVRSLYKNNLTDGGDMMLHYSYFGDTDSVLNDFKNSIPEFKVEVVAENILPESAYVIHKPKTMEVEDFSM